MESILDCIDEELSFDEGEDVEMMDIEEGEVVDANSSVGTNIDNHCDDPQPHKNAKKKKKNRKKKNKKKHGALPRSDGVDIDRFVLSVCKQLRERKSYLVYTAVGVLGVSALSELVKEVDAIQACGGQKTVLGNRNRTSGGILWNILKTRDPHAYKEIMKKGKDFEKQFKRSFNDVQQAGAKATTSDDLMIKSQSQSESAQPNIKEKRGPVHDRIRVPVSYDDLDTIV